MFRATYHIRRMHAPCVHMERVIEMRKEVKNIGLRVDPEVHQKLRYIADYEGRSINGQAYYLILQCIRDFEKEHGPIRPEDLK